MQLKSTPMSLSSSFNVYKYLRLAGRGLIAYFLALVIKICLRLQWRNKTIQKTGLPVLPKSKSLLGVTGVSARNWQRLPDARTDCYKDCSEVYRRDVRTMALYPPIWEEAPVIWTKDPKVIRHIAKENFNNYVKTDGMRKILSSVANHGIFSINHGVN